MKNEFKLRLTESELDKLQRTMSWVKVACRTTEEELLLIENILHKIRKSKLAEDYRK